MNIEPMTRGLLFVGAIVAVMLLFCLLYLPTFTANPQVSAQQSALELAGSVVYQQEGCANCHNQSAYSRYVVSSVGDVARSVFAARTNEPVDSAPDLSLSAGRLATMSKYSYLAERPINVSKVVEILIELKIPYQRADMDGLANRSKLDAVDAYINSKLVR
ncbi:hypothetical protein RsTz2092_12500 [Deferribacterales bacterium RsTz2092]|nr:hypothetical protein AGMMS49941_11210 [Deferribacterales bacterium]